MSNRSECCQYYYIRLNSMPTSVAWPDAEPLPMCRLLQLLSTGDLHGEIRRLRLIGEMERAGYHARHADGCGFDDPVQCPVYAKKTTDEP
jgi:hypothetical protein